MKVVVLGAGVAGLAAAMELSNKHEVYVIEKENYLGGLASSYKIKWNGIRLIPRNYHHILEDDVYTFDTIEKVGLEKDFYWKRIKFAFHIDGKFIRITTLKGFLDFPAPLSEKIKFGLLVLKTTFKKNWSEWEKYNAKEFVEKTVGPNMYKKLIKPLQEFKFGENPDVMSAAWFANRLGGESKNFLKKFGYIDGGLERMIEGMKRYIEKRGGKIFTNAKITKVKKSKGWIEAIEIKQGKKKKKLKCDFVISSIPLNSNIKIFGLKDKKLKKIRYRGSVCVTFGLKKKMSPIYWAMYLDKKYDFGATFEHTNLSSNAAPSGKAVFYAANFSEQKNPIFKKTDKQIISLFTKQLNKVFPGFTKNVEWTRVTKELYSEPIYGKEYKNYKLSMKSEIHNLILCGMPFIFPRIRNMSASIESGIKAAKLISP